MQVQLGNGEERRAEVWQPAVLLPHKKANSLAAPQRILPSTQQGTVIQWKISLLKHFSVLPTVYELEEFCLWAHTPNPHPPWQWRPCSELEYKTLKQTKLRLTPAIQPVTSHCSLHSLFPYLQRKSNACLPAGCALPVTRSIASSTQEHHEGELWHTRCSSSLNPVLQFSTEQALRKMCNKPDSDNAFPVLQRCILLQFRACVQNNCWISNPPFHQAGREAPVHCRQGRSWCFTC